MNDNIRYGNRELHLQTEDGGPKALVITSHLFFNGAVVTSRKTDYSHLAGIPDMDTEVRQLMSRQHQEIRNELLSGKFDETLR